MKISISNIAWEPADDDRVAGALRAGGVEAVDLAPGKYLDVAAATAEEIASVRRRWADRGLRVEGMQSLLFGTTGLNLFGDDGAMLRRLADVCRVGAGLGARSMTFGSPKQRNRGDLSFDEAKNEAVPFFRRIGDVAADHGLLFCLEPNPPVYGCNFMVDAAETADIVTAVDHPAIRMQLDVGALRLNDEPAEAVIDRYAPLFGHVHASEPELALLGTRGADHAGAAAALRRNRPEMIVTIEMLSPKDTDVLPGVEQAVRLAQEVYGPA